MEKSGWVAVRCVIHDPKRSAYEERLTLWRSDNPDEAMDLALAEADEYAEMLGMENLGLAQSYLLSDDPAVSGAEVYSLFRESDLPPDEYLARFFKTGAERERTV